MPTPVLVGVGDFINRSISPSDAREPLDLMLEAITNAIRDTRSADQNALKSLIDSVSVVSTWTWPYPDLPGSIAERLGVKSLKHKELSPLGGNQPAKLADEAARRVANGACVVAVIVGGEALASLTACAKAGKMPPPGWTESKESVDSVFSPRTRELGGDLGGIHSIGAPIQVYPLYENAYRAKKGQSVEQNNEESAQLYADFAKVAAGNPMAWNYGKEPASKEEIGRVSAKNRMICFPYPLLMNAFNNVNLAGACVVTSTDVARKLQIPKSKWIYPLGGAGTRDAYGFWDRPNFHSSPSISRSLDAALRISKIQSADIDVFDFYSCFPIVPKLACAHLGLSLAQKDRSITLLGGLTSFGGAGNNYSMHALIEMARYLRAGKGNNGLVLANGGTVTYQHVLCLSRNPRADGSAYPTANPLPDDLESLPHPEIARDAEGEAVVETYTLDYERSGAPQTGYIVARLKDGRRVLANHKDAETLKELARPAEHIGKTGWISRDSGTEGRSLFKFNGPQSRM